MLIYFDTKNVDDVAKVVCEFFGKSKLNEIGKVERPPNLLELFKNSFQYGIKNIITIPHFNNKDKGLPTNDSIDCFIYTVFSALEDSNNRDNLIKSVEVFEKHEYTDVPLVVFSDNHDLSIYPKGKNKDKNDKQTQMFVLGNIDHPFSSVKTAFQDVKTRLSIKDVSTRKIEHAIKYIERVELDNILLELSPYQNTIIGGFGTGKSFLLNLILNGIDNVEDIYEDLSGLYKNFRLIFSDGTARKSVEEVEGEIKIIRFNQYKDIYFNKCIDEECKNTLETNLSIQFPRLARIGKNTETELNKSVIEFSDIYNENITSIIDYGVLTKRDNKKYTIQINELSNIYEKKEYLNNLHITLEEEKETKILDNSLYSHEEKEKFTNLDELIDEKNKSAEEIKTKVDIYLYRITKKIKEINENASKENLSLASNIRILKEIKDNLINYIESLKKLNKLGNKFEVCYSNEAYNILIKKNAKSTIPNSAFETQCSYKASSEYMDYKKHLLKSDFRIESLFIGIVKTIAGNLRYPGNNDFEVNLNNYLDKYYENFENLKYDILEGTTSLNEKSAGERANLIMRLIFNIVEKEVDDLTPVIVIIDQPEDNLDNKGIKKEVVDKIRNMKTNNSLPQIICVTHNANISISADSENIIIARKEAGKCAYKYSGIEDAKFVDEVCQIVEGGVDALKKRGVKFNIPFIKELNEG